MAIAKYFQNPQKFFNKYILISEVSRDFLFFYWEVRLSTENYVKKLQIIRNEQKSIGRNERKKYNFMNKTWQNIGTERTTRGIYRPKKLIYFTFHAMDCVIQSCVVVASYKFNGDARLRSVHASERKKYEIDRIFEIFKWKEFKINWNMFSSSIFPWTPNSRSADV